MDTFIKITKFIINIITSIIIILGAIFIILFVTGIHPYVVESGSMEPAIKTGSVCFVDKTLKYENMKVGDIIAFKLKSGTAVTHRVYEIKEEGIVTKGDANANVDNVITTPENFIGKNLFSIPKIGFFVKFIQSTRGKIIFATLIIVFLFAGIMLPDSKKKTENK